MARLHVCCNGLGVVNMAKYDDDVGDLPPVGDVAEGCGGRPAAWRTRSVRTSTGPASRTAAISTQHVGKQPAGPPSPELLYGETITDQVVDDQPGDEEARKREEEVDPEVATVQVATVECEHREDGEAAYAIERGHVAQRCFLRTAGRRAASSCRSPAAPRDIAEIVPPRQTCIQHRHCAGNH